MGRRCSSPSRYMAAVAELQDGKIELTIAIITTDPREEWLKVHDRQTSILDLASTMSGLFRAKGLLFTFSGTFPGKKLSSERVGGVAEQLSLIEVRDELTSRSLILRIKFGESPDACKSVAR
jgi:hypothetical protein